MLENKSKTKMVILVRKDLKMKPGKMAAQVGHAVLGVFLDQGEFFVSKSTEDIQEFGLGCHIDSALNDWLENDFTKVCLQVNSEAELLAFEQAAKEAKIPCHLVVDKDYTCFNGQETKTCLAIGPRWNEQIDDICGSLKLY